MKLLEAIREFIEAKEAGFRSKKTIAKYADTLKLFAAHLGKDKPIEDITAEDVRCFLAEARRKGLKPASLDTYYRTLQTFFNWAKAEYELNSHPMQKVEKPRLPKKMPPYLPEDELRKLLSASRFSKHPRRDRAILLLLFDSGIRAGELVNIKVGDVDFSVWVVKVLGKDQEERKVPVGEMTIKAIKEYLGERIKEREAPLFLSSKNGRALTVSGLRQILKRLARKAGIKQEVYPHLLRHTFAYRWIRDGGNLEKLRQIMGHSRLETTSIYAKALQKDVEEEHRRLRPADKIAEAEQLSLW